MLLPVLLAPTHRIVNNYNCILFMKLQLLIVLVWLLVGIVTVQAQNKPVQFTAKKDLPVTSPTQTVTIRVSDFKDVTTVQFSLQWPASTFEFVSIDTASSALPELGFTTNFNANQTTNPGKLTFSWNGSSGEALTLPDNSIAFKINFNVKGAIPKGATLELTPTPTPTELTRSLKPANILFNNERLGDCDCK